jgi:hypothetical protein
LLALVVIQLGKWLCSVNNRSDLALAFPICSSLYRLSTFIVNGVCSVITVAENYSLRQIFWR